MVFTVGHCLVANLSSPSTRDKGKEEKETAHFSYSNTFPCLAHPPTRSKSSKGTISGQIFPEVYTEGFLSSTQDGRMSSNEH
jgi:hypothetical protein